MHYIEERNVINTVKKFLGYYRSGVGDFPFDVIHKDFVSKETSCAYCRLEDRTIVLYLDTDVILSHEITHMVDYIEHPQWFNHQVPQGMVEHLEAGLAYWRSCDRVWENMSDKEYTSDFLTLYVFDGVEIRANVCAYLITGEMPKYLEVIPKAERFVLENASLVDRSLLPEYTPEEYIKRYYSVMDFLNNPTEIAGARLMRKIKNNAVFQKYGM